MNKLPPIRVVPRSPTKRSGKKLFERATSPKTMTLTDRDADILEAASTLRVSSGEQLRQLVLRNSESASSRRLRAHYDNGFLDRIPASSRPRPGIPPFVYVLTKLGEATLREWGRTPRPAGRRKADRIPHDLVRNDFFISLTLACQEHGYTIRDWRDDLRLPTADGRGRTEKIRHQLLTKQASFEPDAYFELQVTPTTSYAFFVEVDMGTHALRVWKHRAKLFTDYLTGGFFKNRFGREQFRLLIICPPNFGRRGQNIITTIQEETPNSPLFLAAGRDEITPETILTPLWRSPGTAHRQSIISNPLTNGRAQAGRARRAASTRIRSRLRSMNTASPKFPSGDHFDA